MNRRQSGRAGFGLYIILAAAVLTAVVLLSIVLRKSSDTAEKEQNSAETAGQTAEADYDKDGTYRPAEESFDYTEKEAPQLSEYGNPGPLSCLFPSGSSFAAGAASSCTDGIILNPVYSCIDDELVMGQEYTQFCFCIQSSGGTITYPDAEPDVATAAANNAETSLYVTDRTYDTLVPAAFKSEDEYGIKWAASPGSTDNEEISFRVIRLPDGHLMGIAKADIVYDGSYSLDNLRYEDAVSSGELTEEWRDRIVNEAVNFLLEGTETQSFAFAGTSWEQPATKAIVDKAQRTYFGKLYDKNSEVTYSGKYIGMDIYAVNINQIGTGFITVYFAPQNQLWGLEGEINSNTGDIDLKLFGYDPIAPFSKDTIAIPEYDRQAFGLAGNEEENF